MAEGIARKVLGTGVHAESAGTHAHMRDPPAANAVKVVRDKFGIDISSHRSRSIYDVHVETFDYVIPMADIIREDLEESYPDLREKLLPSWRIDDPYGGDLWTYEETADAILRRMKELSVFLKSSE